MTSGPFRKISAARRKRTRQGVHHDLQTLLTSYDKFLEEVHPGSGRPLAEATCGVYAFFDFEDQPLYVGQTYEGLKDRIGRHLTGRRSDAVGKHVIDPNEIAEIEVWPMWCLGGMIQASKGLSQASRDRITRMVKKRLNAAEYTVFQRVVRSSAAWRDSGKILVLNESRIAPTTCIALPECMRGSLMEDEVRERLRHPDLRIAAQAGNVGDLAAVIRDRDVNSDIRRVLVRQIERLLALAEQQFDQRSTASARFRLQFNSSVMTALDAVEMSATARDAVWLAAEQAVNARTLKGAESAVIRAHRAYTLAQSQLDRVNACVIGMPHTLIEHSLRNVEIAVNDAAIALETADEAVTRKREKDSSPKN